jgi:hypothetical protein
LHSDIEQQLIDSLGLTVRAPCLGANGTVLMAAELDAHSRSGIVELGLFRRGEILIKDGMEVGRSIIDAGTPVPLELPPSTGWVFQCRPQPLALASGWTGIEKLEPGTILTANAPQAQDAGWPRQVSPLARSLLGEACTL